MIGHCLKNVFHVGSNELENYKSHDKFSVDYHSMAIVISLLGNKHSCHVNPEYLLWLYISEGWPAPLVGHHCHLVSVHNHWSYPLHSTTQ